MTTIKHDKCRSVKQGARCKVMKIRYGALHNKKELQKKRTPNDGDKLQSALIETSYIKHRDGDLMQNTKYSRKADAIPNNADELRSTK